MTRPLALAGLTLMCLTWAVPAHADQRFLATLTGAQQAPAVASTGTGTGTVVLNTAENQITVNMSFSGLTSSAIAAHIHGPAAVGVNATVLFDFAAFVPAATSGNIPQQIFLITPTEVAQLKAGQFYFNIHTANSANGEIRGQILYGARRCLCSAGACGANLHRCDDRGDPDRDQGSSYLGASPRREACRTKAGAEWL